MQSNFPSGKPRTGRGNHKSTNVGSKLLFNQPMQVRSNRRLIEAKEEAIHAQLSTGEPEFGREMMRTIEQGAIASPSVSASIAREQACSAAIRAAFDAGVVTSPIEVCALSYQRNLCSTLSADLQFNFLQIV